MYPYSLNKVLILPLKKKIYWLPVLVDKKLHSLFSPSLPNFTFPRSPNMELIIALFSHVLNFHLFFPKPSAELKKAKKTFSVSVSTEPCLSGTTQPRPPAVQLLPGNVSSIALHIPCTCVLSFIPTSFRVFPPLLCGIHSVDACLGSVHGYKLWDLVYLRLFWLLLELDIHPRLQPSFRIFQGLLCCFLASVNAERVDAILVLDLLCTGLFFSPLQSFWKALRIFSIHSVLKSHRVSWWGPCCAECLWTHSDWWFISLSCNTFLILLLGWFSSYHCNFSVLSFLFPAATH